MVDLREFGERYIASLPEGVRGQAWLRMNAALVRVKPTGADRGRKYVAAAIRYGIADQKRDDRFMFVRQRRGRYADKWVSPVRLTRDTRSSLPTEARDERRWPAHVPPRVRLALKLRADGFGWPEIARVSGYSTALCNLDLHKYRAKLEAWASD